MITFSFKIFILGQHLFKSFDISILDFTKPQPNTGNLNASNTRTHFHKIFFMSIKDSNLYCWPLISS